MVSVPVGEEEITGRSSLEFTIEGRRTSNRIFAKNFSQKLCITSPCQILVENPKPATNGIFTPRIVVGDYPASWIFFPGLAIDG